MFHGYRDLVWRDEKVLKRHSGDGCTSIKVIVLVPLNCILKSGKYFVYFTTNKR